MNQYPKQFVVSVIAMQSAKIGAKKLTRIIRKEVKNSNFKQKIINFQRFFKVCYNIDSAKSVLWDTCYASIYLQTKMKRGKPI